MEPLIALVAGFLGAGLAGLLGVDALEGWQAALRVGLALMFLLTGFAHFQPRMRAEMIAMVPLSMPRPDRLVTLTGLLELAGAVGLLIPWTAPWAAIGLILLLVAMFPANVSAARRGVAQGDPIGRRTLLQAVFIAAAVLTLV
ncbi:DoxX family protein [Streptomyces sp. NBC_01754]|uniref:DoxX family protein n=1 Tax=Streptomyces sp. NBC_01754 TaxID=2975930 RepID=UPI002DDA3E7E|nr:DoxX family protein [Streptomyces sp. NBC_01754]WSC95411.1 DoxX family protein [Streptomyces sp. NBC_01754]